jgi:hypothetical protein
MPNRLNTYDLHSRERKQEESIIVNVLHNNHFPPANVTQKQKRTHTTNLTPINKPQWNTPPKTWCTFTYTGKDTLQITKIFKQTDIHIALKTNNTLQNNLSLFHNPLDKFTKSGVYKLTCQSCQKAYVGQTGRDFHTRYKEHKRAFKHNPQQSNFTKHVTEHKHTFGNVETIMTVLQVHRNSTHLNTIERFYIHKEALDNHLNEDHTDTSNPIFNTILNNRKPA